MLYCITTSTPFNLAFFVAKRMQHSKNSPNEPLPYGLLLSKLLKLFKITYFSLKSKHFISFHPSMDMMSKFSPEGEIIDDYHCALHDHHDHDRSQW